MSRRIREERAREEAYTIELERDILEERARTPEDARRARLLAKAKTDNHFVQSLILGSQLRGHGV